MTNVTQFSVNLKRINLRVRECLKGECSNKFEAWKHNDSTAKKGYGSTREGAIYDWIKNNPSYITVIRLVDLY